MDSELKRIYGFSKEKYNESQISQMSNEELFRASQEDEYVVFYNDVTELLSDLTNDAIYQSWAYFWVIEK